MAMTKKDFEAIAQAITDCRAAIHVSDGSANRIDNMFNSMAKDIAKVVATQSPRFNIKKFLTACGVTL